MECKTIKSFSKKNKPIFDWKIKHGTLNEAQKEANRINAKNGTYIKRVSYQCSKCGFFHVGTSFEMLENKKQNRGWFNKLPKLVGTIDLKQFEKKPKLIEPNHLSGRGNLILKSGQIVTEHLKKIKEGKITGSLILNNGKFKYYIKEKVLKVILPDGSVKMPKIKNIVEEDKEVLTNNQVKRYIKKSYGK